MQRNLKSSSKPPITSDSQRIDVYTYLLIAILSGEKFHMCDEISDLCYFNDLPTYDLESYTELYAQRPRGGNALGAWWSKHRAQAVVQDEDEDSIELVPTVRGMSFRRRAVEKAILLYDKERFIG